MFRNWFYKMIPLLLLLLLLAACKEESPEGEEEAKELGEEENSLWLVDWDYQDGLDIAKEANDKVDNLLLFGAYFNEDAELFYPDNAKKLIEGVKDDKELSEKDVYISIVNDQFLDEGNKLKDPEVLEESLGSKSKRKKHIKSIMKLAENDVVDGIEVDYENIPEDLIDDYLHFIKDLNKALQKEDLSLRVVLEPSFPVEDVDLPEDPLYSVMAYDLYGTHSGPGPKADDEFLDGLANRFLSKPNDVEVAFANGGFSWEDEEASTLTYHQVEEIVEKYDPEITEDEKSGAKTFTYEEAGKEKEVWYVDNDTLEHWRERIKQHDEDMSFSYWRAGG